jgi:hypothetical protein
MTKLTEATLSFMRDNHYRNAGDRTCANCKYCFTNQNGRMRCTGPGPDPDGFNVFQFGVCDNYEKRNTGQILGGIPRKEFEKEHEHE